MDQLRRVRMLPLSSLVSRLGYPSGATVTWAFVNAVDGSIVPPPTTTDFRDTRTPILIASPVTSLSSRSPLDAVIPDEHLRTEPLWAAVFVNEAVRASGWRVRDVIESLINRTSASESKVKTLSGELTEAKHALTISDVKRESLREEIDRILSRNRGDGERDDGPRWFAQCYLDDDDNDGDVRDRDTRDRDCDPYEPDRIRRVAGVNVVGRTLVSIMIVVVAKRNAMIFIVRITGATTTIIVAVLPGAKLVVKRAGS